MFVKVTNGQPSKYPYTLGDLRRENPQTSFPKQVPAETLEAYGVYPVQQKPAPRFDNKTHRMSDSVQLVDGVWTQHWEASELPHGAASVNVRVHRDNLLRETDWTALSDVTMSAEMATYRQALRDITAQPGFPHSVEWPVKP